ncbi:hypothetical protein ACH5RR_023375 [Cinchona calisaya]|uniref:Uncharacterized protein n=1 Tax=Cinchona calisaya TaxID=153742 RepID=A0ABD2ZBL0_9GENT
MKLIVEIYQSSFTTSQPPSRKCWLATNWTRLPLANGQVSSSITLKRLDIMCGDVGIQGFKRYYALEGIEYVMLAIDVGLSRLINRVFDLYVKADILELEPNEDDIGVIKGEEYESRNKQEVAGNSSPEMNQNFCKSCSSFWNLKVTPHFWYIDGLEDMARAQELQGLPPHGN